MGLRWTEIDEQEFRAAANNRPLFHHKTPELKSLFYNHRDLAEQENINDILQIRFIAWELYHYRKKIGYNGNLSLAGKLRAEIESFFDDNRYELFSWPSTWGGRGSTPQAIERREDSPLSRVGYRVGQTGLMEAERRMLLKHVYMLPSTDAAFPDAEWEAWGEPQSAERLYRLAILIAGLIRAASNRRAPPIRALEHWQSDLSWLKARYYDGNYDRWRWPETG